MYPPPPMQRPRPPRQGVPAFGVIVLCVFSLLAGCLAGAVVASPSGGGSAPVTATASPPPAGTSSTVVTRSPDGGGDRKRTRRPRPHRTTAKPKPRRTTAKARRSTPNPHRTTRAPSTDRRYSTCSAAKRHGLGLYRLGVDREYSWYRDADGDGVVCE